MLLAARTVVVVVVTVRVAVLLLLCSATVLLRQLVWREHFIPVRWLRCMTICYLLRGLTLGLTALPGPAQHCRGEYLHRPPKYAGVVTHVLRGLASHWWRISTCAHEHLPALFLPDCTRACSVWGVFARLGAMYGKEENCGDLMFSGHTAFATTSLLSALTGSYAWRPLRRNFAWLAAVAYFTTFVFFMLSARKHYTVDVWSGMMVASLVFVVFGDAWVPPYFQAMLPRKRVSA